MRYPCDREDSFDDGAVDGDEFDRMAVLLGLRLGVGESPYADTREEVHLSEVYSKILGVVSEYFSRASRSVSTQDSSTEPMTRRVLLVASKVHSSDRKSTGEP